MLTAMFSRARMVTSVLAGLAVIASAPATAGATFPGVNGRIVFVRIPPTNDPPDIWTMNAEGGDLRRLTDNGDVFDTVPSPSPDGTRIVFKRFGGTSTPGIYTM